MKFLQVIVLLAIVGFAVVSAGLFRKKQDKGAERPTSLEDCREFRDREKCDVCCTSITKFKYLAGTLERKGSCFCWATGDPIITFNLPAPWRGQEWAEEMHKQHGYTGHLEKKTEQE